MLRFLLIVTLTVTLNGAFTACTVEAVRDEAEVKVDIRRMIGAHLRQFEPCYLQAIEGRPGAQGKIVVEWQIDEQGWPQNTHIKDSDPSLAAAHACMIKTIGSIRFPPADHGEDLIVAYPFYFSENGKYGR